MNTKTMTAQQAFFAVFSAKTVNVYSNGTVSSAERSDVMDALKTVSPDASVMVLVDGQHVEVEMVW